MKKYFFILFLCAGSILSITAQDHFQLGLKLGYNSTSFNTGNTSGFLSEVTDYSFLKAKDDFKSGYNIGVYSRIGLIGNLSLQPELYFSKKSGVTNYSLEEIGTENDVAVSEKVSYYSWDLPILAHMKLVDLKVVNVYGVAGPVASFKASDKLSFTSLSVTEDIDKDKLKGVNWNFQLGAGIEVWKINFDVRYEWGLNDVSKTELDRKTKTLMFSLGYRLFGL